MHTLLLTALSLTVGSSCLAQVSLKNETSRPLSVAVLYTQETQTFKGLETVGWFNIIPGQTVQVLDQTPKDPNIYVYAVDPKTQKEVIGGGVLNRRSDKPSFNALIDPDGLKFTIQNANMSYHLDAHKSYKPVTFSHLPGLVTGTQTVLHLY